jgi:hypothetical protein
VAKYLADFNKYGGGAPNHQWTLEGYATGQWFADGVASMGAAPTRTGFIKWMNSLKDYTVGGFFAPLDYQHIDYTKPRLGDCNTVVQWQDSAKGWVTRAPTTDCVTSTWYAVTPSDDGA